MLILFFGGVAFWKPFLGICMQWIVVVVFCVKR